MCGLADAPGSTSGKHIRDDGTLTENRAEQSSVREPLDLSLSLYGLDILVLFHLRISGVTTLWVLTSRVKILWATEWLSTIKEFRPVMVSSGCGHHATTLLLVILSYLLYVSDVYYRSIRSTHIARTLNVHCWIRECTELPGQVAFCSLVVSATCCARTIDE